MPSTAHTEAAEHHEKAAAEHHDKGDKATASHATEAHGRSAKAHGSSTNDHGKSTAK